MLSLAILIGCQDQSKESKEANCFEGIVEGRDPGCKTIVVNPADTIFANDANELYLIRIINSDKLRGVSTPTLPNALKTIDQKHFFFRIDDTITVYTICDQLFGTTYPFAIITNVNERPCDVFDP